MDGKSASVPEAEWSGSAGLAVGRGQVVRDSDGRMGERGQPNRKTSRQRGPHIDHCVFTLIQSKCLSGNVTVLLIFFKLPAGSA